MSDPTVNAVAATVGPQYPDWLLETKEMGEKDFKLPKDPNTYTVKLFGFNFLGRAFASGVNIDLLQKLLDVQKKMYDLAKRELEKQEDLTPEEFSNWVWMGQNPVWLDRVKVKDIEGHIGYRPNSALHSSGSAVDINVRYNPYMALRKGDTYGGESHPVPGSLAVRKARSDPKNTELLASMSDDELVELADPPKKPKDQKNPPPAPVKNPKIDQIKAALGRAKTDILKALVWKPAVEVYDRAYSLYGGTKANVADHKNKTSAEGIEETVQRFQGVSFAVALYFGFAFKAAKQRSFEEFSALFENSFDNEDGGIHPNATLGTGENLAAAMAANRDRTLHALYDQIVRDRDIIRLGIVIGHVEITDDGADGKASLPTKAPQRDPTRGLLNLRGELIVELVRSGLSWGGTMWEIGKDGSGDMMHFDLRGHFVDGQQVDVKKVDAKKPEGKKPDGKKSDGKKVEGKKT